MISLQALRACLDQLEASSSGPRRRRNRRRRARRGAANPAQPIPPPAPPQPQRRRRARRRRRGAPAPAAGLAAGEVSLSRSERLADCSGPGTVALYPTNFPWLKGLAQVFDLYQFVRAVIEYRPVVGATRDGATAVGFDWGDRDISQGEDGLFRKLTAPTRDAVLACTPSFDTPVWQTRQFTLPPSRLAQKRWFEISSSAKVIETPGVIAWAPVGSTPQMMGEIWIHYTVHLAGTHRA
uniref:Capsid protein n=1 Tax=Kofsystermes virus TaxID=2796604 RepID=A0A7T7GV46_9VIRU|nr:putative coat protein [Kofsystermes virus]